MYNKLFTKILDSSIWLAPDPHRLVWITFLAAMDEDGNAMFASAANVAARARVTREDAEAAIAAFEAPDPDSGDPDNEGRRIERFPGGWHILNAGKYRALVTKAIIREQTRIRVARHREKTNGAVTHEKREANAPVTPSEARALAVSEAEKAAPPSPRKRGGIARPDDVSPEVWESWLDLRKKKRAPVNEAVLSMARQEAGKARLTMEQFLRVWCFRGSQGLMAEWLKPDERGAVQQVTVDRSAEI